ncbi:MAG: response regulator [Acidobacteria bacterium]|nr:response regulator [Acidobacteriota bacterium]
MNTSNQHERAESRDDAWASLLGSCQGAKPWRIGEDRDRIELYTGGVWRSYRCHEVLPAESISRLPGWLASEGASPLAVDLNPGPWLWRHALLERLTAAGPCAGILTERVPAAPPAPECRALISQGPALAVFDERMCLLRSSPLWARMHHLDAVGLDGASFYDLFPGARAGYATVLERCMRGEQMGPLIAELTLAGGASLRSRWDVWPWRNEEGDIAGLILLCAPAGAGCSHRMGLASTQQMLQLAVDILEQRVFWKDRQGRFLGCNLAFARDAGLSDPSEIVGLSDHDMLWSEFAGQYIADDQAIMSSGVPRLNFEERSVTAAGEMWARTSKVPLLDEEGHVYGCLGLSNNITEEKRRSEDLRQARDAAERANRTKSEFLASISHELRTPMHGIIGMSELVLDSPLSGDQKDCVEAIHSSAHVLLHIINDILDLSKIEAGKLQLNPAPFELHAFLKTSLRLLVSTARGKGLEFHIEVAEGTPVHWRGDAIRIAQILTNLAGNAVKFTHEGGSVTVHVSAGDDYAGGRFLILEVADTGIGISKSKQSLIFEAFTQADGATTKQFGGTGLGLTITRQLAEMMAGHITVESDLGKGSIFTCTCRLEVLTEEEFLARTGSEQPRPEPESAASGVSATPLEILLVEDNKVNQRIAQRLLEKEGAVVTIANDGWEALELLDREGLHGRFDLVLMDCLMPVMNGWDATRAIRQREEGVPGHLTVMALTASVMESDRELCRNAGMDDVLAKPIDQSHLHHALEQVRRARDLARLSYNLQ